MSLYRQQGTEKALIVATIGTIAAIGATCVVRAVKKTKPVLLPPNKDAEHYERAPLIDYQPSNPNDPETYHYDSNPTVFGRILRGELRCRLLLETEEWVGFEDISPRAPLHALIVSKRRILSILDLDTSHESMLRRLHLRAHQLLQKRHPEAYKRGDYKLCFHIPPLHSVDHLHLHVLAPASCLTELGKIEFASNPPTRWNICLERVLERLHEGSSPTPFSGNDGILRVLSDTLLSLGRVLVTSNRLTMWKGRDQALNDILHKNQ